MIVRAVDDELWLFDQNDHAALCGVMARAWGMAPFAPAPEAARRAAEFHDNGWREWDVRPRLDPQTGHPHPYSRMPPGDYLEIWRRGLSRAWEDDEAAGLLVSLHAMRFFARRTRPEDRALYAEQRRRQAAALARLGAPGADPDALPEPWASWHAWVFFWDALSLLLCEGWDTPWTREIPTLSGEPCEVRVARQDAGEDGNALGGVLTLEPYPFTGPLRLDAPARVVPLRSHDTQAVLDEALRTADRRRAVWTLRPARDET